MFNIYKSELEAIVETKIKPNLKAIYNMRVKGLRDKHIAQYLGITTHMFLKALDESEEIKDVYNDATILLCAELRDVAINRALGTDGKTDKDGNEVGPDANLAVRLLEKLDPTFAQKDEVKVTITIEDIVRQLNEKRRIEYEKREAIIEKNEEKGIDII